MLWSFDRGRRVPPGWSSRLSVSRFPFTTPLLRARSGNGHVGCSFQEHKLLVRHDGYLSQLLNISPLITLDVHGYLSQGLLCSHSILTHTHTHIRAHFSRLCDGHDRWDNVQNELLQTPGTHIFRCMYVLWLVTVLLPLLLNVEL